MLVVFDLETTGLNVNEDRIVQFAAVKVDENFVEQDRLVKLLNPTIPIQKGASKVHGIRDEDVQSCPKFKQVVQEVVEFFGDCDLGGYNVLNYDIPLLQKEMERCGVTFEISGRRVYDAQRIFQSYEDYTLSSAYRLYCRDELEGAHDALADTSATLAVLESQLELYKNHKDKPVQNLGDLHEASIGDRVDSKGVLVWKEGEACMGFGKHNGKTLKSVAEKHPAYLRWMLKGNFSDEVRGIAKQALSGEFPERATA